MKFIRVFLYLIPDRSPGVVSSMESRSPKYSSMMAFSSPESFMSSSTLLTASRDSVSSFFKPIPYHSLEKKEHLTWSYLVLQNRRRTARHSPRGWEHQRLRRQHCLEIEPQYSWSWCHILEAAR